MNWKEFWFGQLVTDDNANSGLNIVLADIKEAIENAVKDMNLDGVHSGLDVTENSPTPDMTVDISVGVAYDHDGERTPVSPAQSADLSGITLPAGGNEKWVSIFLAFSQTDSVPWKDDAGVDGYWKHDEGFEIELVEGAEATPPASRPSLHPSKVLLADVKLVNAQTQIFDADIYTDRREIALYSAGNVGVDSSGWTVLDNTVRDLQSALDDADDKIIDVDGSGELTQDLIPDADGTRDLGDKVTPKRWNAYLKTAEAYDLTILNQLLASADGKEIGSLTARFFAYLTTLNLYDELVIASANVDIGTAANSVRETFTRKLTIVNASPGPAVALSSAKSYVKYLPMRAFVPLFGSGWQYGEYNVGAVYLGLYVSGPASAQRADAALLLPDGAYVTTIDVSWYQGNDVATDISLRFKSVTAAGVQSTLASLTSPSAFTVWVTNTLTVNQTLDNDTYSYILDAQSGGGGSGINGIRSIKINYTLTDLLACPGW